VFISALMWNGSGWDSVGLLAAETVEPQKTYPTAMMISMLLVNGTYLFPILVSTCIDENWSQWRDGEFDRMAAQVGGPFLENFFVLGAAACCIGIFTALLTTSSRQMYSMSKMGLLPSIFGKLHPRWGTPVFAILVNGVIVSLLTLFPFQKLLEISVISNAVITLLTFLSFLIIRRKYFPLPNEIPTGGQTEVPLHLQRKLDSPRGSSVSGGSVTGSEAEMVVGGVDGSGAGGGAGGKQRTAGDSWVFRVPMSTRVATVYSLLPLGLCVFGIAVSSELAKVVSFGFLLIGSALYFVLQQ